MMLDFDDITPRDAMNTRITLFRKGQNPAFDKGVHMDIAPNETVPSLYKHASERLGVNEISRIINIDGDVIDDLVMINQDDILYVLVGDEDQRHANEGTSRSLLRNEEGSESGDSNKEEESEDEQDQGAAGSQELIGNYYQGKFLGSGSFGKVHIGIHRMTGEKVALKFMNKGELGSFQDAERVFTEIQCLNSLDHPNVIKLQQVIDMPDFMVLALEFASGGDLKEVVDARGALDEDVASHLFVQILDGVAYCHRHNIVHYDLKLENILLTYHDEHARYPASPKSRQTMPVSFPDSASGDLLTTAETRATVTSVSSEDKAQTFHKKRGVHELTPDQLKTLQVKIADFGLSQLCNPGQTSDYSAGSLAYIAPEVFHGGETAGVPRDVWAMGVILFNMVTGRLPFYGTTYADVSSSIRKGNYTFREGDRVSESCKQIIAAMLQVSPEERMTVSELRIMPWIDRGLPHTRAKTPLEDSNDAKPSKDKEKSKEKDKETDKEKEQQVENEIKQGERQDGNESASSLQINIDTQQQSEPTADHRTSQDDDINSQGSARFRVHSPKASGRRQLSSQTVVNTHRRVLDVENDHVLDDKPRASSREGKKRSTTTEIGRPPSSGSSASSTRDKTKLPAIRLGSPKAEQEVRRKSSPKSAPNSPSVRKSVHVNQ